MQNHVLSIIVGLVVYNIVLTLVILFTVAQIRRDQNAIRKEREVLLPGRQEVHPQADRSDSLRENKTEA